MNTTTRDEIIAERQKAVDRVYDCYEQRLAELTGGSVASASASGKDSFANRSDIEEKAAEYAGFADALLVVSRVDRTGSRIPGTSAVVPFPMGDPRHGRRAVDHPVGVEVQGPARCHG